MEDGPVQSLSSVTRLNRTLERRSLRDLVASRKTSILVVDCSGSMDNATSCGVRKIDEMRNVVTTLRETHPVPVVAFGRVGHDEVAAALVSDVPTVAQGSTPMAQAIDYAADQRATHLIIVSDGYPDDPDAAIAAAQRFGHQIDTFFIGDPGEDGERFLKQLATLAGGHAGVTDLGAPAELVTRLKGLLTDGGRS